MLINNYNFFKKTYGMLAYCEHPVQFFIVVMQITVIKVCHFIEMFQCKRISCDWEASQSKAILYKDIRRTVVRFLRDKFPSWAAVLVRESTFSLIVFITLENLSQAFRKWFYWKVSGFLHARYVAASENKRSEKKKPFSTEKFCFTAELRSVKVLRKQKH